MQATTKRELKVLGAMYAGYAALMLARQTVIIMSPAMVDDPGLGLSIAEIGRILGFGTAGALVGKLLWGPLSDRLGGRKSFLIGIGLAAVLIGAFSLVPYAALFSVLSFCLYGAKSAGWPAMTKLVEVWYPTERYGRVWGVLSTSSRASVVLGTLVLGGLLAWLDWRYVALIAMALALGVLWLCRVSLVERPARLRQVQEVSPCEEGEAQAIRSRTLHPLERASSAEALLDFARSPRVWLICLSLMALTVLMEFLSFVPLYLKQSFEIEPARAASASSVFPLGSLLAVLAAGFLYDRATPRQLRVAMAVLLAGACACLVVLLQLPSLGLAPERAFSVTLALIFVFGAAISPAYYIPMSIFSMQYGGRHSGLLVCLIDVFGFLAAMAFDFGGGMIAEGPGGWQHLIELLVFVSIAAGVFSVWFLGADASARAAELEAPLAEAA